MTKTEHKKVIQKFWQEDFPNCIAGKKGAKSYEDLFKEYSFFAPIANKKPRKGPAEIAEHWRTMAPPKPKFEVSLSNIHIFENIHFLFKESLSCYTPFDKIAVAYVNFISNPKETLFCAVMGHIEDCTWVPIEFGL
jgi:hypothetical protein